MALASAVVWEVRTDGADTNGGGFKAGASGTDWSQQASAQYSVTDAVTNGTTTITSATANFGTDVVGNLLYISGGTGSITGDWYEITARGSATSITVDRSTGLTTGTGATLKIGGALASPGLAASKHTAGNTIWIKTGTYTVSTATPGAGGPIHSTGASVGVYVRGYRATRGDRTDSPPVTLQCSAGTMSVVKLTGVSYDTTDSTKVCEQVCVDANGQASITGFEGDGNYGSEGAFYRCKAVSCAVGFQVASMMMGGCWAKDCTTGFQATTGKSWVAQYCVAEGGTTGFSGPTHLAVHLAHCVAVGCGGDGFVIKGYGDCHLTNCVAHGCTGDGFQRDDYNMGSFINCVSTSNGGYGFRLVASVCPVVMLGCATYGNTSGATTTITLRTGSVTALSSPPWRGASVDMRPVRSVPAVFSDALGVCRPYSPSMMGAWLPDLSVSPRTRAVKGL